MSNPHRTRMAELDAKVNYFTKELTTRETNLLRIDEQLGKTSSKTKDFTVVAGLREEHRAITAELEDLRESLADTERERRDARHEASVYEARIQSWQRTLALPQELANNPRIGRPDEWFSDPILNLLRSVRVAAQGLRSAGYPVPEELTITLNTRDMELPTRYPDSTPVMEVDETDDEESLQAA